MNICRYVFLHMYMYMCRNLSTHVCTHLYVQEVFPICAGSVPTHVYVQEVFLNIFILAGRIPAHDVQEIFLLHVHVYMCRKYSCTSICAGSVPTHVYIYMYS